MAFGDDLNEGHADGEEPLHFYYNREERLKNAPQLVQDYYSGKWKMNKGFRVLFQNRANRLMLFVLLMCLIFLFFTTTLTSADKAKINGIQVQLSSFSYEEEIYVSLKINKSKNTEEIPIEMTAVCYDIDKQPSLEQKVTGFYNGSEVFLRTKFSDYDIINVQAEIKVGTETAKLTASVVRR